MKTNMINFQFILLAFVGCLFWFESVQAQTDCKTIVTTTTNDYLLSKQSVKDQLAPSSFDGLKSVPVQIHIIRTTSGTTTANYQSIQNELALTNQRYVGANIAFFECGSVKYINNDTYYNAFESNESTICSSNNVANVLNIYFVPLSGYCGWAYFPGSAQDWVVMSNSCSTNGSTLTHELGHYFSLYHTHETFRGRENVNRTSTNTCYNCTTAGDGLCDTPADPTLSSSNINFTNTSTCTYTYTGTSVDNCGSTYAPNARNIMSYSPNKVCRDYFSPGQLTRIAQSLLVDRSYLQCSTNCPATLTLGGASCPAVKSEASNWITSTCMVSGTNTKYDAGQYVLLNTGFQTSASTVFSAYIDGCGGLVSTPNDAFVERNDLNNRITEQGEASTNTLAARSRGVQVFPNPTSGMLQVQWSEVGEMPYELNVFDLQGKRIQQYNTLQSSRQNLDVSGLSAGVYLLELRYKAQSPIQQRFVKH